MLARLIQMPTVQQLLTKTCCPRFLIDAHQDPHHSITGAQFEHFLQWVAFSEFAEATTPANFMQCVNTVLATTTESSNCLSIVDPFINSRPERKDQLDFVMETIAKTVGTVNFEDRFDVLEDHTTFGNPPPPGHYATGVRSLKVMTTGILKEAYIAPFL